MPANSNYTWESTHSSSGASDSNRRLKGWLVIAGGLSFIAHAALWVWFTQTTLPDTSRTVIAMMDKTQTFKIERVTLNDVVLNEDESRDEEQMAEILDTNAAPLVKEINEDDPNIYDKLPDHQVKLTSTVDEMSKFLASERPSIKGDNNDLADTLAPEDVFSTEALEDAISKMKGRIKLPDRVSDDQLPIKIDDEDLELMNGDGLDEMTLALAKAAGNANLTKGFSNLDDLLNRTGPLLDDTKPILIPSDLLFRFNESDLPEEGNLSIMKLGLLIARNEKSKFIIEGHTDTLGSKEYNMQLSLKRAESVRDWMAESIGLNVDRVEVKGFGETRPLVATGDKDAQAINRRVEIAIKPVEE